MSPCRLGLEQVREVAVVRHVDICERRAVRREYSDVLGAVVRDRCR